MFYVYILKCIDDTLYVGSTNNLEKRLHEHNNAKKGAHYTKIRRPVVVKYFEKYKTLSEARSREHSIKKITRLQKLKLISLLKNKDVYFLEKLVYTVTMAKRLSQDIKNKTSRSRKTKKRLGVKNAMLAVKRSKIRKSARKGKKQ